MNFFVVKIFLVEDGILVFAFVFPSGDVHVILVVAFGFAVFGLAFFAEVTAARFLTVEGVEGDELRDFEEVGETNRLFEFLVEFGLVAGNLDVGPEFLAEFFDLLDRGLETFFITGHTAVFPHDVTELLVEGVDGLLTLDAEDLVDLVDDGLFSFVEGLVLRVDLRRLNLVREVVADRVGKDVVTVGETLHEGGGAEAVAAVLKFASPRA